MYFVLLMLFGETFKIVKVVFQGFLVLVTPWLSFQYQLNELVPISVNYPLS